MNFTQLHERLRLELLRRIQRGTLSVSLLARQTGFGQSHLSNFLHSRRQLSLEALDRILAAQRIAADDLLPSRADARWRANPEIAAVPLVSHASAMNEVVVRSSSIQGAMLLPGPLLQSAPARTSAQRRHWQRFVAVSISPGEAQAMRPVLQPDSAVLIDRHYSSLLRVRQERENLYAVRHQSMLKIRYADFLLSRLVLRPLNLDYPVELCDLAPGEAPADLIVGRVLFILNQH